MAWFLSDRQIHNVSLWTEAFGDPRKKPLFEMQYADPAGVDWRARGKISRTIQMLHGYSVVEATAPKKLHWNGGNRALPEVLVNGGVFVVGERFRAMVERFEPGTHQLIPVDVYRNRKGEPAARYHWFNVCTRLDSVDPSARHTYGSRATRARSTGAT